MTVQIEVNFSKALSQTNNYFIDSPKALIKAVSTLKKGFTEGFSNSFLIEKGILTGVVLEDVFFEEEDRSYLMHVKTVLLAENVEYRYVMHLFPVFSVSKKLAAYVQNSIDSMNFLLEHVIDRHHTDVDFWIKSAFVMKQYNKLGIPFKIRSVKSDVSMYQLLHQKNLIDTLDGMADPRCIKQLGRTPCQVVFCPDKEKTYFFHTQVAETGALQ